MIISKTPMRVSFVGGGSDLPDYYKRNGGAVVSTAIDKYIYVIVNHRFDGAIRVAYSKSETVDRIEDVEHDVIREALKLTGVTDSIEISYVGDIPIGRAGTGLGSSSALAVGVLNALYAYKGERVTKEKLAHEASQIEIDILKRPIGKQDQYAAAYGGLNFFEFKPDGKVKVTPIKKNGFAKNLLMFHTNLPTQGSTVLAEQKKNTRNNINSLDAMVTMAKTAKKDLKRGLHKTLGAMLHDNWMHKKRLASLISNPTIDAWYEKALKAGALGGKILGSGGGGFLLFYCPKEKQKALRNALRELQEIPFNFTNEGTTILYT